MRHRKYFDRRCAYLVHVDDDCGDLREFATYLSDLGVAKCEVIILDGARALGDLSAMLDAHEGVEPQDYFEPLPWWGGIDAGRMLVQRAIEPPCRGKTFAFRRSAVRGLREMQRVPAPDVFVRRLPPNVGAWLEERPRQAGDDFHFPVKTALFFALLPLAVLLGVAGGVRLAGGYASAIAFASIALAVRGRIGAAPF